MLSPHATDLSFKPRHAQIKIIAIHLILYKLRKKKLTNFDAARRVDLHEKRRRRQKARGFLRFLPILPLNASIVAGD